MEVLKEVNLADFLKGEDGLDTKLLEKASNFSGGQCQRLALARALLHDSPVYILMRQRLILMLKVKMEIMERIYELAKTKTVILISHRLANVTGADNIYVLESGNVAECGTHEELLDRHGVYEKLWNAQQELESFGKGDSMNTHKKEADLKVMTSLIGLVKTDDRIYDSCNSDGTYGTSLCIIYNDFGRICNIKCLRKK